MKTNCQIQTHEHPVAASRQSAAFVRAENGGALTRRRYRVLAVHAGCEISRLTPLGNSLARLFSQGPFGTKLSLNFRKALRLVQI